MTPSVKVELKTYKNYEFVCPKCKNPKIGIYYNFETINDSYDDYIISYICQSCIEKLFEELKKCNPSKYEIVSGTSKYQNMELSLTNLDSIINEKKISVWEISSILDELNDK